jgi:hypothetical protein
VSQIVVQDSLRLQRPAPIADNLGEPMRRLLLFLAFTGTLTAADSPFAGQWRLNPAKSQLAGISTTFTRLPSGKIFMASEGQSYEFRMDGKVFKAQPGVTVTWTQLDDHTWLTVYRNQTMRTTETTRLSADGQTLTVVRQGTKPNGEKFEETATSQRLSGGPGLLGQWRTTQVKPVTQMWKIEPDGDGLTVNLVDFHAACTLKFDGKDYPVNGPTVPPEYTLSMKRTGPRSLQITEKVHGRTVYTDAFSISADGKTLTTESAAPGSSEKTRAVYDRQ